MPADGSGSLLDRAWTQIPSAGREARVPAGSFTRARVERIIDVVAAFGSVVLGTQSLLVAISTPAAEPWYRQPLIIVTMGLLAIMIAACIVGRAVRVSAGAFAVMFLLALTVWPMSPSAQVAVPEPWIWYLVNIATLAAVLAFPFPLQVVWTVLTPILYGVVRIVSSDFEADLGFIVALDVSFALILGGVLLALGWLFRAVAANVDATRTQAVDVYARAAAADAAEQERVAIAALMHDSVLAALIAAERADSDRARTLAVAMAREAMSGLATTEQESGSGSDEPQDAALIAEDVEAAAAEMGVDLHVTRSISFATIILPGRVAEAITLAAAQAVANAVEHAGGEGLEVTLDAVRSGIRLEVRDRGGGFDLDSVPDDRLGIRGSIVARMASIGGTARISSDADGTVVRLVWRGGPS
ncbi:ATP-binding protein [Microbacterium thalassium]|uniref:histidine kinase n=1 Tax=Microbacterium thalassium TaxID=362649 RepID=A0A7X0FPN3_9MICO|nr:ATP-binding protein [Microbacterium thalassium]MBB6391281.1 signal transduction histidine kinase [Microbacterium thalassium]GLK23607.1 histidine kinase [Microbacterium thalassium]